MNTQHHMINRSIRLLPEFIANQIAAGEVVQRPESVVKELVENSIDAGASEIGVIIRDAGKQLIHIIDNGTGMSKEDLELSVKRHATSKIVDVKDLEEIHTFGFRGEALASICSVAQVEIRTKRENESRGWKLMSEPLKEPVIEPVLSDLGTQIFVRNLFYNVPARRKFLRTNLTEFRYISDTMIKFALSKTNLRFTFYDSDQLIFDLHQSDSENRIIETLGREMANKLIKLDYTNDLISITGFLGTPDIARQTRANQYLFLNGRSIINRSLSHAVYSGFESIIEKNKHPLYVINIELDPKKVDVNIHPQKHEVKFDDEKLVYNSVLEATLESFKKYHLIPDIKFLEKISRNPFRRDLPSQQTGLDSDLMVNKITGEIINTTIPAATKDSSKFNRSDWEVSYREQMPRKDVSAYDVLFGKPEMKTDDSKTLTTFFDITNDFLLIGQIFNTFIIVQNEKGVLFISQSDAHERVIYDTIIKRFPYENAPVQELIFPIEINLNPLQFAILDKLKSEFLELGYNFEINPNKMLLLKAVPLEIQPGFEERSFIATLDSFNSGYDYTQYSGFEKLALAYSKTASIKSGIELSSEKMKSLIDNLFKCDNPIISPTGRKIITFFSLPDINKMFE